MDIVIATLMCSCTFDLMRTSHNCLVKWRVWDGSETNIDKKWPFVLGYTLVLMICACCSPTKHFNFQLLFLQFDRLKLYTVYNKRGSILLDFTITYKSYDCRSTVAQLGCKCCSKLTMKWIDNGHLGPLD